MRAGRFSVTTQDDCFHQLSNILGREDSHPQPADSPKLVIRQFTCSAPNLFLHVFPHTDKVLHTNFMYKVLFKSTGMAN